MLPRTRFTRVARCNRGGAAAAAGGRTTAAAAAGGGARLRADRRRGGGPAVPVSRGLRERPSWCHRCAGGRLARRPRAVVWRDMAAAGGAATGRIDADGREWDTRQRECQRSMCKLMAHPCGKAELAKSGSGWVVRNDVEVAALVTVRHVFKHVMEAGRLTGRVTATWADGQKLSLAGASVLSAPEPGATADPPPDMDALVVRLAPGKLFPAPPVPCAVATVDADGSVADADHVLVQPGAACTLLHYPRGEGWQGDGSGGECWRQGRHCDRRWRPALVLDAQLGVGRGLLGWDAD